MKTSRRHLIIRIVALLAAIALSILIYIYKDQAGRFAIYGYPGIFILSFLSYATVFLPAPGIAIVFAMGGVFNPWLVALAASMGAALGELVGYLAGFGGQVVTEKIDIYNRLTAWMHKNGKLTIVILAAIPNPFFDIAGFIAGNLKMPVLQFLLWCWIGETIKMVFFAFAGSRLISLIPFFS
jgi:uncharacterized membrane protein YdjX (TVP38/TMEM64 family)